MSVNVGTAVAYLTLDKSRFKNSLSGAGADLKNFATGTGGVEEKVESLGSALTNTGNAMMKPSIAAGGFLAMASKTTMDFEASMSNVSALSGATGEDLKELGLKAREMGKSTSKSAKDSGDAMGYMAL